MRGRGRERQVVGAVPPSFLHSHRRQQCNSVDIVTGGTVSTLPLVPSARRGRDGKGRVGVRRAPRVLDDATPYTVQAIRCTTGVRLSIQEISIRPENVRQRVHPWIEV